MFILTYKMISWLRYTVVQPKQSHHFSPGHCSPGQFSPGDIVVRGTMQSWTIQSRQISPSQYSLSTLVQPIQSRIMQSMTFLRHFSPDTMQSRGLCSPRHCSPYQYSMGDNVVQPNLVWETIYSCHFSLTDNVVHRTLQAKAVQSIQFCPKNSLVPDNLVQERERTMQSGQCSLANIVPPMQSYLF